MKTLQKTLALLTVLSLPAWTAPAAAPAAKDPKIIATVNGAPIKKAEAIERTWKEHGSTVLAEMVDETIIDQAAKDQGVAAKTEEVDGRLKRIQGQYKDEAAFTASLKTRGTTIEAVRAVITTQVLRENLVIKAKNIQVTDAEVKAYFDANKDNLGAEAYHLRHILVASEKQAADFMSALKAGADFSKLAAEASMDQTTKNNGGDLGFISKNVLRPEIAKAVSSLKPGETIGPIKYENGGAQILRLEEVRPAQTPDFDKIKGDISAALLADKINKAWSGYLLELRNKAKIVVQ